jgi:ABC-type branched-subunit amino acid transport system substrate-binding protein
MIAHTHDLRKSDELIRVGVLFAQTGYFAAIETAYLMGTILGIAAINDAGGISGRPIVPVIYDPMSNAAAYPHLAQRMMRDDGVSCIFGCVTSVARKAVLPVVERMGGLLWYPTQCEGFECSDNIVYGGPCPNQHVVPLCTYLLGCGRRRMVLIGSDYVFPRECLRIFRDTANAASADVLAEYYLDVGADEAAVFETLRRALALRPDVIVSAVVEPNLSHLFRCYRAAGGDAEKVPIATIANSKFDAAVLGSDCLHGHIAVGAYFESLHSDSNDKFLAELHQRYGVGCRGNMMTEASYAQVLLFARGAEAGGSTASEALLDAIRKVEIDAPQGRIHVDPKSNYIHTRPRIGIADQAGNYSVVFEANQTVAPDPYMLTYA